MASYVQTNFHCKNKMLNYDIIDKECDSYDYIICFYVLSIHSYADRNKLKHLTNSKS